MKKRTTLPIDLRFPFLTLLKLFAFALLILALWKLASLVFLIYFATLLAVTVDPLVEWLRKHRIRRGISVALIAILSFGALAGFFVLILPPLVSELGTIMQEIPKLKQQILHEMPNNQILGPISENMLKKPPSDGASGKILDHALSAGGLALGGLSQFVLLLILAIYLLHDGRTLKRWVLDFFDDKTQRKLEETCTELEKVIVAYVAGQMITSILVVVFVFTLLTILKIPTALVLAILAGVFDVLPVAGFFISIIPVALMALTVSPKSALIVAIAYLVYHQLENYFIGPQVYGNRMRLSTLTVMLGLLAGALVAGIPGALAILPILAAYPVIERIWLVDLLGSETVRRHRASDTESKVPATGKVKRD